MAETDSFISWEAQIDYEVKGRAKMELEILYYHKKGCNIFASMNFKSRLSDKDLLSPERQSYQGYNNMYSNNMLIVVWVNNLFWKYIFNYIMKIYSYDKI